MDLKSIFQMVIQPFVLSLKDLIQKNTTDFIIDNQTVADLFVNISWCSY